MQSEVDCSLSTPLTTATVTHRALDVRDEGNVVTKLDDDQ